MGQLYVTYHSIPNPSFHPEEKARKTSLKMSRKHQCVMSKVNEINIVTELCTAESPATINHDKMCLHYVIHYIKRGTWDKIIPEITEEEKPRIDGYQCNVCNKKFRNNHSRGEYPARGSFICHWATEHGKVVEAMKDDVEVDMETVLELFEEHDERVGGFIKNGTKTDHDDNPAKVIESLTWRIQADSSVIQNRNRGFKPVIKCPKCKEYDRNRDPNNLKLHIFHHYLDFWKEKIPILETKETLCEQCTPNKRIVGANSEGCRTALICHRAIHHDELREALKGDPDLPEGFIEELFGEKTSKPVKVLQVGVSKDAEKTNEEEKTNVSEERERIAQEVRKREMMKIFDSKKKEDKLENTSKKNKRDWNDLENLLAKKMKNNRDNLPYVGKRIKQNLKDIDFNDDSEEDEDWIKDPEHKAASSRSVLRATPTNLRMARPKRQVAPTNLSENVDNQDISDEEEDL